MTEVEATTASSGEVSADEVRAVRFSKVIGRGYEQNEVDAFVDKCAAWIDWFNQQLRTAQRRVSELEQDHGADRAQLAVQVLTNAQQTADMTVRQADQYSLRVMSEAKELYEDARLRIAALEQEAVAKAQVLREEAATLAEHAHRESTGQADALYLSAQQQAATLLREAEVRVEEITADARRTAADLDGENRSRMDELGQAATRRQAELDEHTAYLEALRDNSRAQMQTFLQGLLNQLSDEHGRGDPAAVDDLTQIRRPAGGPFPARRIVGRPKRTARRSSRSRSTTGAARPSAPVPAEETSVGHGAAREAADGPDPR